MKTRTQIRRENLVALVSVHGQAGVAEIVGKDRNQVYQWGLEPPDKAARNISDRSAALIEDAFGKPRGWLDQEQESPMVREASAISGGASQTGRPDFEKMAGAIYMLREYLEIMGEPAGWIADPVMLEVAYQAVEAFGQPVTASNVIDLTKRFANQIRSAGGRQGDERGSVGGDGTSTGAPRRRTA